MRILLNDVQPVVNDSTGQHDQANFGDRSFYRFAVTYTSNGQQFAGEAYATTPNFKWSTGREYDCNIKQDERCIGGIRLTNFSDPSHTGGTNFQRGNGQNTTQTTAPQYGQQTVTAPSTQQTQTSTATPSYQKPSYSTNDPAKQALIVAQSSMKTATEFWAHLTEIERNAERERLYNAGIQEPDVDMITKIAGKIAAETVIIAKKIEPSI